MAGGTVVERIHGNDYALLHVYGSWWFAGLWGMAAMVMIVMWARRKIWKRPAICLTHGFFLVILLGALLTTIIGQHSKTETETETSTRQPTMERHSESQTELLPLFLPPHRIYPAQKAGNPRTLPKESADKMGRMFVMYKGRVCPLQTLAKDFTTKLYGKARHHGYTPEQVFSGWLFYYDDWVNEPIPKLQKNLNRGKHRSANEKIQIINMLQSGQWLKMFPHADSAQQVTWYSQNDPLPVDIPDDEVLFIRKQMSLCREYVRTGDWEALDDLFDKTKIYQEKYALGHTQPLTQYRAERLYNRLTMGRWLPITNITLGLICFAIALIRLGKGQKLHKSIRQAAMTWMSLLCAFLALIFTLRWIVGGHVPMAGSFDFMNLLALSICIITLIITMVETHGRASLQNTGINYEMALPAGLLMTGVVLLVQMMGGANPPVTQLMPALSSPLLSLHVSVIIMAYALIFFIMLNGICAVAVRVSQPANIAYLKRLQDISTIMLYPAVALLAAGIIIGAVWADIAWGNYWSWDPKEVWALITLLVYAVPLHKTVWKSFQRPMFFHIYSILAFLSVLITYFGVNFLLGGMHSYAVILHSKFIILNS